jgi:hypothetical protein
LLDVAGPCAAWTDDDADSRADVRGRDPWPDRCSPCARKPGTQKGAIELNAYAIFAVNEHLEFLLDEAARNRTPKAHKPGLRSRIASRIDKVRTTLAESAHETSSILPKLEDYPYRS